MNEATRQMHSDLADLRKAYKNTLTVKMEMLEKAHEYSKQLSNLDTDSHEYFVLLTAMSTLRTYADKL